MIPIIKALEDPKQRRALHEMKARLEKKERHEAKKGNHDGRDARAHKA
jgi:hypothetical protein